MTQQQSTTPRASAADIRTEVFGHRMRGLDEAEVREYLDTLADQVEACDAERAAQQAEIERLRSENYGLREQVEQAADEVSPQAVALFSQAQQVADQLVEEAVTHARDLMMSARHQQRDIIQRAHDSAEEMAKRASVPQLAQSVLPAVVSQGYTTPVPEIEYVRTFARVAQVQLRSVLDALNDQVDRLSEVPQLDSAGVKGAEVRPPDEGPSEAGSLEAGQPEPGQLEVGETEDEGASELYEQLWSVQTKGAE